jgi:hypothetical protein
MVSVPNWTGEKVRNDRIYAVETETNNYLPGRWGKKPDESGYYQRSFAVQLIEVR